MADIGILNITVRANRWPFIHTYRTISVDYGTRTTGWRLNLFGWKFDATATTPIKFERANG